VRPFRSDDRLCVQTVLAGVRGGHPTINGHRLDALLAMFGNSFVTCRDAGRHDARRPARPPVFNLGRNEPLFVRAAQVALLLDHG